MKFQKKVALNISLWFSIIFGLITIFIYFSFSSYRKYEFEYMLEERAFANVLEAKDLTPSDVNKIFNEECLVFDKNFKLIYTNKPGKVVRWDEITLHKLAKTKKIYLQSNDIELLAIRFIHDKEDYYAYISAEDKYGNSKLDFLFQALILTYLLGMALLWFATSYFVGRSIQPLILFKNQISSISLSDTTTFLNEEVDIDEIGELAKRFNQMLLRIQEAYNSQKEFSANVSHELRTPLSRATLQIDTLLGNDKTDPLTQDYLHRIGSDLSQISDLITSLLILSKVKSKDENLKFQLQRIDEIIFDAYKEVKLIEPNFQLNFDIVENEYSENDLEILCNRPLLLILFVNLLKNGCLYSLSNKVTLVIDLTINNILAITLSNDGNKLEQLEQEHIFDPFTRGTNSHNTKGLGLGLRIVKGILEQHQGTIKYYSDSNFEHNFLIEVPYL